METYGPLFDACWYAARNPDVVGAGADALTHFVQYGAGERRDPNPLFDIDWYLKRYPHVAGTGLNPLDHYLVSGAAEGLDPHPLFDTDWYLAENPDVADAGVNPLAHFLEFGANESRAPHPAFEYDWSRANMREARVSHAHPVIVSRPNWPLVSVVLPVFNEQEHLRECLLSILSQSLSELEVICVDDASTDASPTILAELAARDSRIVVLRNVVNAGAGQSRNVGLHFARGSFIQFTNASDILPNNALRTLYNILNADDVPIARGRVICFRCSSEILATNNEPGEICRDARRMVLADTPDLWIPWWHTSYLINTSFLRSARASYPSLSKGEDAVFIAALLAHAETISTTSETVYMRRIRDPRRKTRLTRSIDYVRHAAMVRRLYLNRRSRYWCDGYRPFLLSRADQLFFEPDLMLNVEQQVIKIAMIKAGIGTYLPFSQRLQRG